jgi:hypothetical protein
MRANFGVKLSRPGFGPAAELPAFCQRDGVTPLWLRHADRLRSLHQGRSMKAIVKGGPLLC